MKLTEENVFTAAAFVTALIIVVLFCSCYSTYRISPTDFMSDPYEAAAMMKNNEGKDSCWIADVGDGWVTIRCRK